MNHLKPLITFIMCSRKKDNPDSKLKDFLDSLIKYIPDGEKSKIEVLIKFDSDDTDSYRTILNRNYGSVNRYDQPNFLATVPTYIRPFVYARGEGRRSLQNDYMFLFTQRNPHSKFISFVTDDCVFIRPNLFQFLNDLKNKDWVFMGDKEPQAHIYRDWRKNQVWRTDVSMFPIVSTKIIECCGSMGFQTNIDNWLTLLHSILVQKYGLDFWVGTREKYINRIGGKSKESQYGARYNPMEIDNKFKCENDYYFDLVEQQAKNIFFNHSVEKFHKIANIVKKEMS